MWTSPASGTTTPRLLGDRAKQDTRETSDKLAALFRASSHPPSAICVDDIGVGGGVTDNLKAAGLPVRPINVGEAADDSDKFANKRAELTWNLRSTLEDGGGLPDDERVRSELSAFAIWSDPAGSQWKARTNSNVGSGRVLTMPMPSCWRSPSHEAPSGTSIFGGSRSC